MGRGSERSIYSSRGSLKAVERVGAGKREESEAGARAGEGAGEEAVKLVWTVAGAA